MVMALANITHLLSTLIAANHVLHYHGILDAYGHISVRNPNNASTFFLSRDMPPALVSSSSDIIEYRIDDASPIDPNAPRGFIERFIHSEAMKRYPTINSVIHSHAPAVIPYGITQVPLLPVGQSGSVLGLSLCNASPPQLIPKQAKVPRYLKLATISSRRILTLYSFSMLASARPSHRCFPTSITAQTSASVLSIMSFSCVAMAWRSLDRIS